MTYDYIIHFLEIRTFASLCNERMDENFVLSLFIVFSILAQFNIIGSLYYRTVEMLFPSDNFKLLISKYTGVLELDHSSWSHVDVSDWYDRDSSKICELENLEI